MSHFALPVIFLKKKMIETLKKLRKVPHFYQLFSARTVSNFGNGISPVALAFGVLGIEGADAGDLSLVMASRALPVLFLLVVGGAFADKYGRARTMGWSDIILGVLISITAASFIFGAETIWLLVLVGIFSGILNGLWYPAFTGLMPIVVPREHLQGANAATGFGSNIAFMVGTVSGGLVVSTLGVGWALAIDAASFIVAGAMILPLAKLKQVGQLEPGETTNFFHEIRVGWKEFSSRSWLVAIVIAFAFISMTFEATWAVLGAVQSQDNYNGSATWGLILAFMSIGFLLGTVISNKVRPRRPLIFIMTTMLLLPIFLLTFGLSFPLPIILLSAIGAGIAIDCYYVLWMTTVQTNVPEESLSRVNSYDAFGTYVLGPIAIAIAGPISLTVGVEVALVACAAVATVAISLSLLVPSVRKLRAPTP